MPRRSVLLVAVYVLFALVALYATWSHNLAYFASPGTRSLAEFISLGYVNHVAASLTNDMLCVALLVSVFMLVEGRRIGVRHAWLYVALSFAIAISVMLPLFLAAREVKLARSRFASESPR